MKSKVATPEKVPIHPGPLYTGRLFHFFMLNKSSCPYRGVLFFDPFNLFLMENQLLANTADPDQITHYVTSDLGLHCLPITLLQISR